LEPLMTTLAYDAARGTFRAVQTLPTVPGKFSGLNQCGAVRVSPDGRFVYGSNRGHDSLVAYAVDPTRGTLTLTGHAASGGAWPRDFALDPTGRFLLVANQASDRVCTFRIDPASGALTPTGHGADVPEPAFVAVVP
ncbi:MAG: beta-propeller fold lactonase family protein, partial [Catalinimonas sp.]